MERYIVGLGEALWDVLPEGAKLGGAPANFAYHASQFGHSAVAVSAFGQRRLRRPNCKRTGRKGFETHHAPCGLSYGNGRGRTRCRRGTHLRHPDWCGMGLHSFHA